MDDVGKQRGKNAHVDDGAMCDLFPGVALKKMTDIVAIGADQSFHGFRESFGPVWVICHVVEYWKISIERKIPTGMILFFRRPILLGGFDDLGRRWEGVLQGIAQPIDGSFIADQSTRPCRMSDETNARFAKYVIGHGLTQEASKMAFVYTGIRRNI